MLVHGDKYIMGCTTTVDDMRQFWLGRLDGRVEELLRNDQTSLPVTKMTQKLKKIVLTLLPVHS